MLSRGVLGAIAPRIAAAGGAEDPGNLFTNNKAFDHADWTKERSTITANSTADPQGGSLADTLNEDGTAASSHNCQQAITKPASTPITYDFTIWAKQNLRTRVTLMLYDNGSAGALMPFDLAGGQIGAPPSFFGSGFTAGTPAITADANGFYKCEFRDVAVNTATTVLKAIILVDGGSGGPGNVPVTDFNGLSQASLYIYRAVLVVS